jgi:hypothetical protein
MTWSDPGCETGIAIQAEGGQQMLASGIHINPT